MGFLGANSLRFAALALAMVLGLGDARAAEPVTLQLKWRHQFQFAGYYAALEKGFYREAGLDVTILEGGPSIDVTNEVANGRADYAVGNAAVLLDRQAGKDFVVLAVIFQHSPAVLISPRRSGVRQLSDVAGKRLMDAPGSQEIGAMLKKAGVDYASLPRVEHGGDPLDLLAGKADLMIAYSTNEPFVIERTGEPYIAFTPRSSGVDLYGDNLYTRGERIAKQPKQVQAFRDATLRGWRYAVENRQEIVDLIVAKYRPAKGRDALMFEAEQTALLIQADLVDLGYQSEARWRHVAEVFAAQGMLPAGVDHQAVIYEPAVHTVDARLVWAAAVLLGLTVVLAAVAAVFLRMSGRLRQQVAEQGRMRAELARSEVVKSNVAALSAELQNATSLNELATRFLSFVAPLVGMRAGALYVRDGTCLAFAGGYGVTAPNLSLVPVGEGLVGQCALDGAPLSIAPPAADARPIRLGVGVLTPAELLLLPVFYTDALTGVVEMASLERFDGAAREMLDALLPALASTLQVLARNLHTERLLDEARRQESRLRDDEARCRAVFAALPEAMLVVDPAGTIVLASAPLEALFGYAAGELAGRAWSDLLPQAAPPADGECLVIGKDGRRVPVVVAAKPLAGASGHCVRVREASGRPGGRPEEGA